MAEHIPKTKQSVQGPEVQRVQGVGEAPWLVWKREAAHEGSIRGYKDHGDVDSIPEAGGELSDRRVARSGLQIVRRILTAGMDWRGEEQR